VALPTCELAIAESERYLPSLISKIEAIMQEYGLSEDAIVIRMSGCPNGCSRPYLAEIAFVGRALNSYNMYLGASFAGQRLSKLYRENLGEKEILEELRPLIRQYAEEREAGEHFGGFVVRKGHVQPVYDGRDFHS
jgi:sulfite reductase (NADPH) hemoprotein beta-component